MGMIAYLVSLAFDIYIGIIVIQVVVSWLIIFDVINAENAQAQNLVALLKRATDPIYKPLQKYIPPIGGIDVTPIVVILGLSLLQNIVVGVLI
ncbi:MAG TPA: YggT family protein [Alphaproteobacteria bacterium]|nr:YggT family protein [Alphaproteobacteria bacterium]USO04751.1 MAG: YggT family protein [Rhodospirillales bacterium]HOO81263.1 YggT family protein [Alphaproteobacteria bacterium]